jgi:Uma2 family endonuclease
MRKQATKCYTPEEYLELEEAARCRNEYYRGEIFPMVGDSINHNRIIGNLSSKLSQAFDNNNCESFTSEIKIWIEEKDLFTYPDVIVVCGEPEFYQDRDDTITNPIIIIEVLSDSTKNYDRIEKFEFYRTLPSFEEYILIDQYRVHVEHFCLESM